MKTNQMSRRIAAGIAGIALAAAGLALSAPAAGAAGSGAGLGLGGAIGVAGPVVWSADDPAVVVLDGLPIVSVLAPEVPHDHDHSGSSDYAEQDCSEYL